MRKTKNDIKIFTEKSTLAMALSLFLLMLVPSIIVIVTSFFNDTIGEAIVITSFFGGCCIIAGVTLIVEAKKWAATIHLSNEGIEYKKFLNDAIKKSYRDFPYITKAYRSRSAYSHSIELSKKFIVFSGKPLNETEIYCLTNVPNSSDLFKIEYTKKNYQKLLNILPKSHKIQLIEEFKDLV